MQGAMRVGRLLVVVVWVALLLILVKRQLPVHRAGPPAQPAAVPAAAAEESWMGLYMQGRKIGYAHQRLAPAADGYRTQEQSVLRLTVLDSEQTIRVAATAETTRDYALRSFAISLRSGLGDLHVRGTVEEGALALRLTMGREEREERVSIGAPVYLPSAARHHLAAGRLRSGERLAVQVFDPSAMQNHPMEISVERREPLVVDGVSVDAWRVRESFRGVDTTVWFDDSGRVLREQGPLGLVAVRESAEAAVSGWQDNAAFDLMAAIAVPVAQTIPTPREVSELEVRLAGLGATAPPDDGRQSYRDGTLRVRREDTAGGGTYERPYRGGKWREELAPTPFLQSDHPRVRRTAEEILAGETDARRAADRLRQWVHRHLEKRATASIPNALQVLEMGAGDCNEHAVLWAALARAAGLPARVVAGLVYIDGVFLYHAWNEVWLGTAWTSVDAAFDQMPADGTHIKLIEGGPEAHIALLPIIGRVSIEVIAARAEPQG